MSGADHTATIMIGPKKTISREVCLCYFSSHFQTRRGSNIVPGTDSCSTQASNMDFYDEEDGDCNDYDDDDDDDEALDSGDSASARHL